MEEHEFELVDNARSRFSHHGIDRLKALAPTFPERSPQRLACAELIAEKEREIAANSARTALRRANQALLAAWAGLFTAAVALGVHFFSWQAPRAASTALPPAKPLAIPPPTRPVSNPEPESTPEPLPASLGELPVSPR
jgi:hypothetical protein